MRKTMLMLVMLLLVIIVVGTGCKKARDKWNAEGSFFGIGNSGADYIVVNYSGSIICDVYKLKNEFVQSPENSDGWLFLANGNPINIGGDSKLIRCRKSDGGLWEKYHEYHMEFESKTYRELYNYN